MKNNKCKLLVLEGIDGAGKGTQLNLIKNYLSSKNLKFHHLHFPMYGHNEFSDIIAKFLRGELGENDKVDPYFVATIYAMDRFKYLPELQKLMEENDVVILDRYVLSNIAYQSSKISNTEDIIKIKNWILDFEFKFLDLPYPDLTLFLDVPVEITKERLENQREGSDRDYLNGKKDIHEADLSFQVKVRNMYNSFSEMDNYHIIECAGYIEDKMIYMSYIPEYIFETYKHFIDEII